MQNERQLREMRSRLTASGILAEVQPHETGLVIVPSRRIRAGRFALLLLDNGIRCRALGHGTGRVQDAKGNEFKEKGILVLAVETKLARKTELFARLFGVMALPVGQP